MDRCPDLNDLPEQLLSITMMWYYTIVQPIRIAMTPALVLILNQLPGNCTHKVHNCDLVPQPYTWPRCSQSFYPFTFSDTCSHPLQTFLG